jgi:EAL domain-containing protein (putative c-di-GMP-specific phosphodiesterase class I)
MPFGMHILKAACQQLKRWGTQFPQVSNLMMSVNLSAQQLKAPDLVERISEVLAQTQVNPKSLILELTESAMIDDPESAVVVLNRLRDLGIQLHLDDFGTGYSSLSSLHLFPLNGLKIDRSFVKYLSERRDYRAVVEAIISLARHLDMKLIAEGIETADQVELLRSMDCDLVQGYYFSRPTDNAGAEAFIAQQIRPQAFAA